jgi:YtoQ family protein
VQKDRAARFATGLDGDARGLPDLLDAPGGLEVAQVAQPAEGVVDPAPRRVDRDADAVVFADEQDRHRAAASMRVTRRVDPGEGGGMVGGRVAEGAADQRAGGMLVVDSEPPRAPQGEGGPDRFRYVRSDRARLRRHPKLAAAPDLVPAVGDRLLDAGAEAEQRVEQRRGGGVPSRARHHESAASVVQKTRIGQLELRPDDRVVLVAGAGNGVVADTLRLEAAGRDVELPAEHLVFEQRGGGRGGERATRVERLTGRQRGRLDGLGQVAVEIGLDDFDASGGHAGIIAFPVAHATCRSRKMRRRFGGRYNRGMQWQVYLSGEIHTDWRERIAAGVEKSGLPVTLLAPVTDHAASDDCGVSILGEEDQGFWKDTKGAGVNAIRTRNLIAKADVVVVRFGEKYKQWNAAFDAGYASALGKTIITLHAPELTHALKEVDRAALAVAERPEQVVEILDYVIRS